MKVERTGAILFSVVLFLFGLAIGIPALGNDSPAAILALLTANAACWGALVALYRAALSR